MQITLNNATATLVLRKLGHNFPAQDEETQENILAVVMQITNCGRDACRDILMQAHLNRVREEQDKEYELILWGMDTKHNMPQLAIRDTAEKNRFGGVAFCAFVTGESVKQVIHQLQNPDSTVPKWDQAEHAVEALQL